MSASRRVPSAPARHRFAHGLFIAAWSLILLATGSAAIIAGGLQPGGQMAAVITATLVSQTNDERTDAGLGSLRVNPTLVAAAQAKADDMAQEGYFSHTSPDGTSSWTWFEQAGYAFAYAGENLAVNFTDSRDVTDAWMRSPTHRANILNGRFTEVGIASAVGEYKGKRAVFVVQMFGTPAAHAGVAAPVSVDPRTPAPAPTRMPAVLGAETAAPAPDPVPMPIPEPARGEEAQAATVPDAVALPPEAGTEASAPSSAVSSFAAEAAASPRATLRTVYLLASVLILFGLIAAAGVELSRHHRRHAIAAIGLLAVLSASLFLADRFLFPTPVIGSVSSPSEG